MTLQEEFDEAVAASKQLTDKPDNDTLLNIYSLYKQATVGNAPEDMEFGMFDFVEKAKYQAWLSLKGIKKEDAMQDYVQVINKLKK